MRHTALAAVLAGAVGLAVWSGGAGAARAQQAQGPPPAYQMQRFYYYPYYYWPHNYWPLLGPQWPEQPGMPYMRPPAYMAYPPFLEPNWRYDWWHPLTYYRGFHFWLDQF
jgi:hypothetical protein